MKEQTLAIIKPDAVAADLIGSINQRIEQAGLHIIAMKMLQALLRGRVTRSSSGR